MISMVRKFGCMAVLAATSLHGACQWIVFDPTNFLQNYITAVEAVEEVANTIEQLAVQRQQYSNMVEQIRGIDGRALVLNAATSLTESDLRNLASMLTASRSMQGDIGTIQRLFESRLGEARVMGMSWGNYVRAENRLIASNQEGALARVRTEQHALDRVSKDFEFIRDQAARIPASTGIHSSMQQLNVQVNRMLQQNTELLRVLATANGTQAAERQMQEAEARRADVDARDAANTLLTTSESGGRTALENWFQQH